MISNEENFLLIKRIKEELDYAKIHFEQLAYQIEELGESFSIKETEET